MPFFTDSLVHVSVFSFYINVRLTVPIASIVVRLRLAPA